MIKINNNPLRELARSEYYQNLYRSSKELNGIFIFDNHKDLTKLQIIFLSFLALYDSVYIDIASNDSNLMSLDRIKDDMLVDAYITVKNKNRNKKDNIDKPKKNSSGIPSISFVTPKKRQ